MLRVAILDGEDSEVSALSDHLDRFAAERGEAFSTSVFHNAVSFLADYKADYDLIFMDIRMPYISGMDAAKMLREKDRDVALIFVTSLAQYAVDSYKVEASDYLLKPISYTDFALSLTRVLSKLNRDETIVISFKSEYNRIRVNDIYYVETLPNHRVCYHTRVGDYMRLASLRKVEGELGPYGFASCNQCYLVNLSYVERVDGYLCLLRNGTTLQISQPKKKSFFAAFSLKYR